MVVCYGEQSVSRLSPSPHLYIERCNRCGLCVEVCSRGVLVLDPCELRVDQERECDGCATCEEICPQDAIDYPFEIVWADEENAESASGGEPSA
jgi:ferredoxin